MNKHFKTGISHQNVDLEYFSKNPGFKILGLIFLLISKYNIPSRKRNKIKNDKKLILKDPPFKVDSLMLIFNHLTFKQKEDVIYRAEITVFVSFFDMSEKICVL